MDNEWTATTPSVPCSRIGPGWTVPGELRVALVGEHGHPVRPAPGGLGAEIAQAAGRVGRRVRPQQQGPGGVGRRRWRPRSRPPSRPGGGGTGTARQPGQLGAHGVGRVRHRRVEHGVALGLAQAQHVGRGGDQLLRPDARGHRRGHLVQPEATGQPRRRGLAQQRAPRRGGVAPLVSEVASASTTLGSGGSQGVPMEQSTMPPGCACGQLGQAVEAVVGIRRQAERHRLRHELGEAGPAHVVQHHPHAWPTPRR